MLTGCGQPGSGPPCLGRGPASWSHHRGPEPRRGPCDWGSLICGHRLEILNNSVFESVLISEVRAQCSTLDRELGPSADTRRPHYLFQLPASSPWVQSASPLQPPGAVALHPCPPRRATTFNCPPAGGDSSPGPLCLSSGQLHGMETMWLMPQNPSLCLDPRSTNVHMQRIFPRGYGNEAESPRTSRAGHGALCRRNSLC